MKIKDTKGITLIALIITIIVLVILAGVVIATLNGNNIMENANKAVGKYNNKAKEEEDILDELEEKLKEYAEKNNNQGYDKITATTVASDASYIGKYVNYNDPSGDPDVKWRIFYADNANIYLIASDYLKYDYVPTKGSATMNKYNDYSLSFSNMDKAYTGSEDIKDTRITKWIKWVGQNPSSTNENIRAIAYMLDTGIWNTMYANNYAEYAIGGPTIEMFCASYKATHPSRYIECGSEGWNEYGYKVKWSDGSYSTKISGLDTSELENLYVISDQSKTNGYWLASPGDNDSLLIVYCYGHVDSRTIGIPGLRALVCLKSNVQLVPTENENTYNLNLTN